MQDDKNVFRNVRDQLLAKFRSKLVDYATVQEKSGKTKTEIYIDIKERFFTGSESISSDVFFYDYNRAGILKNPTLEWLYQQHLAQRHQPINSIRALYANSVRTPRCRSISPSPKRITLANNVNMTSLDKLSSTTFSNSAASSRKISQRLSSAESSIPTILLSDVVKHCDTVKRAYIELRALHQSRTGRYKRIMCSALFVQPLTPAVFFKLVEEYKISPNDRIIQKLLGIHERCSNESLWDQSLSESSSDATPKKYMLIDDLTSAQAMKPGKI